MRALLSKGIVAISKPRCGSTSVRRMLNPHLDREAGDIAVDLAGQNPPFHPHMTAPYLKEVLGELHPNATAEYFITVRHPLEMLWSYFKFFRPDRNHRYNFAAKWDGNDLLGFEEWVTLGRIGANPNWLRLAPSWICTADLSPLSLEAHAANRNGEIVVDRIFLIEEPEKIAAWLGDRLGTDVPVHHVNRSQEGACPPLGAEALDRVRRMLPAESRIYNL